MGEQLKKREEGCPAGLCATLPLPERYGHRLTVVGPGWRGWFRCPGLGLLWGNTSWAEMSQDPGIISRRCVIHCRFPQGHTIPAISVCSALHPGLRWASFHPSPTGCSSLPVSCFGNMCLWAVSQPQTEDNLWQNVVATDSLFFSPFTQIYERKSVIYKLLGKRVVIIFSPLFCYFLAGFLMV